MEWNLIRLTLKILKTDCKSALLSHCGRHNLNTARVIGKLTKKFEGSRSVTDIVIQALQNIISVSRSVANNSNKWTPQQLDLDYD